jgi:hypothetical protein
LDRNLFPATRRSLDLRGLGHVRSHRQANAAKQLNALGYRINQLILLAVMLIEEQVELVKGGAGNLPMTFLVEVTQSHRVRKQLIQLVSNLHAYWFFQFER